MTITDGWSSNAVSTYLYSDSGYSSSSLIDWEGCETNCTVYFDYENLDANKSYYLKLSGFGTVTYDLTISRGGSEGSKNNPVELTLGSAQSGTIDNKAYYGYSFYKFTTSGADNYTLSMNNSDSLDCSLYSDSAYTSTVNWYYSDCTAGTNLTETFTGTSSSEGLSGNTSYYLRIEGELSTAKTTTYSITIAAEGN